MKLTLIVTASLALFSGGCAGHQLPKMGALPAGALPTSDIANLNTWISNLTFELQEVNNDPFSVLLVQENQLISTLESSLTNLTTSITELISVQGIAPPPATAKGLLDQTINLIRGQLDKLIDLLQARLDKAVADENSALANFVASVFHALTQILAPLALLQRAVMDF